MTPYLLRCLACDDIRNVGHARTFCVCGRSSARALENAIVLIGPGRVVDASLQDADVAVIRPSVAVAT
jgi:hypothetical protein